MTILAAAGDVSPGLLGFVVVAGLGIALYLLVKSMNKQISKIDLPHENEQESNGKVNGTPKPNGAH
ncbi:hypothetical protein Misp01_24770 [Microtetraspora sp. NBRC 13810]|uniref:hypothetical protein n=1 Tax=Microtetraspora sp. NBRC 13810 TaxID=3030990 RepID=UPI0024A4889D|nr:hypothetical protein [Microtetraspora sp. NBRC 13810]GLW07347.1 hypothetical protein Misp01_24770 [Microtetraspora sp. NBRC 13810]